MQSTNGHAPACEQCDDRGWVSPPGRPREVRRCTCWSSPPLETLLANSRMSAPEIAAALDPWDESYSPRPNFAEAWALSRAVAPGSDPWALVLMSARAIENRTAPGINTGELLDPGAPGRGKTKAAAMAMAKWCDTRRMPGLWVNVPTDLDDAMDERARFHVALAEIEERIINSPFVVLDDAGAERGNEARAAAFSSWVYRRHRDRKPTIITTNAATIDGVGDGRIASRLSEADVRYFTGARDYRELMAEVRG